MGVNSLGFDIKRNFTETLKLLISLTGREEIMIENFKGILEYGDDRIRINTKCGVIRITGKNLVLGQITSECLNIKGVLSSIEFI